MIPVNASARPRLQSRLLCLLLIFCASSVLNMGCGARKAPETKPRYAALPPKDVPAFLKDTIFEYVDLTANEAAQVSGYAVIANINGTGNNGPYPFAVREFMIRQMVKRGIGSSRSEGDARIQPEEMLRDPRVAIVRVDGFIPPGAREGQRFDVQVSALPGSNTGSLAGGNVFSTDLTTGAARSEVPGPIIDIRAVASGEVFVNPAYALSAPNTPAARASLRSGVILGGAVAQFDRPLLLRLRQPELRMSRMIERRIALHFQDPTVARAHDEGLIRLYVPMSFRGNWEHFAGLATHLYLNDSPDFKIAKAQELAQEAIKPNAPLLDISWCWEGLGTSALSSIIPLMTHPSPDVSYAAARAAAFIGEQSAQDVLVKIATTTGHPFQVNAIQTLGELPHTPKIASHLREVLNTSAAVARIEAYRYLARQQDSSIYSQVIDGRFMLDIVPCDGPTVIYASRSEIARIAVIGRSPRVSMPLVFTAMDDTLQLSARDGDSNVTIFYRGERVRNPVPIYSRPDVAELIARLGGEGGAREVGVRFAYGEIVALLQLLADKEKILPARDGPRAPVVFVLQDAPEFSDEILNAPVIMDPTAGRPQDEPKPANGNNTGPSPK